MPTIRPLLAILAVAIATPAAADDLRNDLSADMPELMSLYRDLHANPELSFEEHETAAKLATIARDLGFAVTEGVGRTGVVAVMENGPGPVVMLRADMDGLAGRPSRPGCPSPRPAPRRPPAASTSGVMHACGHDTHMAAWVGAARGC